MKTICMISCLHGLYDDRIYWKEGVSLQKAGYQVIHLAIGSKYQDFISEEGIRLIELARKCYFKNPIIDKLFRTITFRPNSYKQIFSISKKLRADAYHIHDYQLNRIGPQLKKLPHQPKVINDVHEPYPEIAKYLHSAIGILKLAHYFHSQTIHRLQIKASRNYDAIITTEENVATYFKKHVPESHIQSIYNYSSYSNETNVSTLKKYDAIYSGGISTWRGIFELLNTARYAKEQNSDMKILCVGHVKQPGLKDKIQDFIKRYSLQEHFVLQDFVPYHDLKAYYKNSGCGLCLFQDNPVYHIIMPIKIFEYMAMGLPIICNNFGHPGRIVKQEKCGITISKLTPETIYNAIVQVKNSSTLHETCAKNGIAAYQSKYNWSIMEQELVALYKLLLKS